MTSLGITRQAIVNELQAHESDSYYLGTPYHGDDWQSPKGDTSYNGQAGMNCGGFVSYVLRKAGINTSAVMELIQQVKGQTSWFGSGKPYDIMAGASNYRNLVENAELTAYVFQTKSEMLNSGVLEKGDIILMWYSRTPDPGEDNHIGFYWGDYEGDDLLWHSSESNPGGNAITSITPKSATSIYIVIKIEPSKPKEYTVTLTKTSADVSITQGNSAYSLAGAVYNVYKGTTASGSVVATFTTDSSGHATITPPLEDGTYAVKEVKPAKGFKLDPQTHVFTIDGADTSLNVQDVWSKKIVKQVQAHKVMPVWPERFTEYPIKKAGKP